MAATAAPKFESNKLCVCCPCLDKEGTCETLLIHEKHVEVVQFLITRDRRFLTISTSLRGTIVSHTALLAYFSSVIREEVVRQFKNAKILNYIELRGIVQQHKYVESARYCLQDALGCLLEWCYTGTIELESQYKFLCDNRFLEGLWDLAGVLDMPEFATSSCVFSCLSTAGIAAWIGKIHSYLGNFRHISFRAWPTNYELHWRYGLMDNPILNFIMGGSVTALRNLRALPMNPEFSPLFYMPAYVHDPEEWIDHLPGQRYSENFENVSTERTLCGVEADNFNFPKEFEFTENELTTADLVKSFELALYDENVQNNTPNSRGNTEPVDENQISSSSSSCSSTTGRSFNSEDSSDTDTEENTNDETFHTRGSTDLTDLADEDHSNSSSAFHRKKRLISRSYNYDKYQDNSSSSPGGTKRLRLNTGTP
ncbi:hypothetical protein HD806DRAFT_544105 [Xylariaceae sp. AK1471]|nr:hypothetical protein HD806DRAFT_544105 [Xylariaceae sp. AK1471]